MTSIFGNSALDALATPQASATAPKNNTLGQDAFLKLLTTQLKTQDPFDPVDNAQMVAQMAQFSSVAGISEMNQSLKAMSEEMAASRVGSASNWIGRNALIETDVATPLSDGRYAGEIALPEDADAVSISMIDANGAVVHQQTLGAQKAGMVSFAWDGKGANGAVAATGPLQVVVNATKANGVVKSSVATWTGIAGVQSPASGSTKLVTPLGLIDPTDALRLS